MASFLLKNITKPIAVTITALIHKFLTVKKVYLLTSYLSCYKKVV